MQCISKEHLQPYIWVVPSLFQESACGDLVFFKGTLSLKQALTPMPFFKVIESIHSFSSSDPFHEGPFFYYKIAITVKHSFENTVFWKNLKRSIHCTKNEVLIKDFFSKVTKSWENCGFGHIYQRKLHFLCSDMSRALCLFHNTSCSHSL